MHFSEQLVTAVILTTLIGSYVIGNLSDFLNLLSLNPSLPAEFKDHYDRQKYEDSQSYLKATTRFGFFTSSFDLAIILLFWFFKGFQYTDAFVRAFGFSSIVSGLLFIGILLLLRTLVFLPFNIYSTFVIEEKFGFNKTSPRIFVMDLIKSIVLSCLLGGFLLALILFLLEFSGPYAWVYCWVASAVFLLAVQYIVPTWIMPLFNKFTPLEDGPLKEAIFKYADSIDFSLSNVFVMDGSKRSNKSNAFFAGFGKNKRIVLFDTLIENQTVDELVAVLAHEMGHYKKQHIIKRIILAVFQMGLIFYLLSIFISSESLFAAFYMENISVYAGLIFFGMLYSPIDFFLSIFFQALSRKDEYEADRFAATTLGESKSLVNALKKLSVHNLSNLTPHPFYVVLNYSHPPVLERIRALKPL
ncbi:MAG: M48 family metallopeptidase [Proteobacteria bacterium]|nr:M48 family metallopeptidase [Pseudomonadota bacterium]MBU1386377.1 M48 family metallopeptidase [Pseudomonadota bacterium]MBU1544488.1 M48 family metallopeptidase [Pseudomonadota bacterium]MBU2429940.1 M48 family metallopeptidase [Pseudomonadota bacterium]MBU2480333.1 M48 family metallopeptidase [Pseudomonadota bacterium]